MLAEEDVLQSELTDLNGLADEDMVAVFLTAGQVYDFHVATVPGGNPDPDLLLHDAEGNEIDFDDTDITGFNPGASPGGTGTGWYFLQVTNNAGAYRLFFDDTASGTPFGFDVPSTVSTPAGLVANAGGDVFGQNPFNLPLGDTITGDIETSGDADWYAINLVAGFQYRFTAELGADDVALQLRDDTGATVLGGAVSGAGVQTLDFTAAATGLYYVDVHGADAGGIGAFTLTSQLLAVAALAPVAAHDITGTDDGTVYTGSAGTDDLTGGAGADSMDGKDGNDTLNGGGGSDTIFGNAGSDSLLGGLGADSLQGGAGDTAAGGDGNDTIDGGGNGLLDGGNNDDTIFANGHDTALGGEGNDTIDGDGGGFNLLDGGNGNDTFIVEPGDTVIAGAGVDHITSFVGWTLDGDEENLTLLGGAALNGNGNGGANVIFGNDGNNQLSGLAGGDTLSGGAANDTLIGGAGKDLNTGGGGLDHIKYNALSDSGSTFAARDAINTFAHGDKIDLSALDANSNVAGNQAFTFTSAQALTGLSGLLIAQQVATNSFLVLADVNGDRVADFSLNVYTSPGFGTFHGWDFVL